MQLFVVLYCNKPALVKQQLKGARFNIKCRNFKLKPEEVAKRYGITQGGTSFLFAVETLDNAHLFINMRQGGVKIK